MVKNKDITYNVVIKSVNSTQHCELFKSFSQHSSRSASHKCKFDLKKVDIILGQLKSTPSLKPPILRPLLT